MTSKRGFLLAEETLKIIISVIAITFLIYFLVSLYNTNKDSQDLELAQASLDHLIEEVNAKSPIVDIYNPDGWSILSWLEGGDDLRACSNLGWKKCVCLCESPGIWGNKDILENCNSGYCLETENINLPNYISLVKGELPVELNINYGDEITITRG